MDVQEEWHAFADAAAGQTAALVSRPAGGAKILWREEGTGQKWALVRLSNTERTHFLSKIPSSGIPARAGLLTGAKACELHQIHNDGSIGPVLDANGQTVEVGVRHHGPQPIRGPVDPTNPQFLVVTWDGHQSWVVDPPSQTLLCQPAARIQSKSWGLAKELRYIGGQWQAVGAVVCRACQSQPSPRTINKVTTDIAVLALRRAGKNEKAGDILKSSHFYANALTIPSLNPFAALPDGPEVGVGFVVTRENWREIGEFLARAADSGAGNVRLSAFFQDQGVDYYRDIFDELRSSIDDARRKHESESFRIYDNFGDRYDDMRAGFPDYQHCGYQYFTTYIGADLKLYRCCNLSYSGRGVVGDLAGARFRDVWVAAATRRRDFDPSQNCPRCRFNKINETIQYATGSGGRHANFT